MLVWKMVFSTSLAALVAAGIDVDGDERLGLVDDDVTAARQPDLAVKGVVDLLLHAVPLEDRRRLGVMLDAALGPARDAARPAPASAARRAGSSQMTASISSVRKSRTVRSIRSGSRKTQTGAGFSETCCSMERHCSTSRPRSRTKYRARWPSPAVRTMTPIPSGTSSSRRILRSRSRSFGSSILREMPLWSRIGHQHQVTARRARYWW